jgi:hypothetical protein
VSAETQHRSAPVSWPTLGPITKIIVTGSAVRLAVGAVTRGSGIASVEIAERRVRSFTRGLSTPDPAARLWPAIESIG